MQNDHKWDRLRSLLADMGMSVIAFSGGVDSAVLLRVAANIMGPNLIAVTAVSDTYPPGELDLAKAFAASIGIRHRIIPSTELDQEAFVQNGPDRCYYCKRDLFLTLRRIAESEGIPHVLDGTNADDRRDYRPGRRAAEELGVRSPLAEADLTKQDIREKARELDLPMWDKPSLACLSSRIPYGTRITPGLLQKIHSAELVVKGIGLRQVRVRHHGDTARIEIALEEFPKVLERGAQQRIVTSLKELGYVYVCLDLQGFRSGSMNEVITKEQVAKSS